MEFHIFNGCMFFGLLSKRINCFYRVGLEPFLPFRYGNVMYTH